VPNPTNPRSFNRYAYVQNSPLNRVDPSGHYDHQAVHHDLTQKKSRKVAGNAYKLALDLGKMPRSGYAGAKKAADAIADRNKGVDLSTRTSLNPIERDDSRPVSDYWHFTSLEDTESRLQEAIEAKDHTAFGRALHAYPDYWSHTRKGFTFVSGDAGEDDLARLCPKCSTLMSKEVLSERSRVRGHYPEKWNDEYAADGPIGTVDMDDVWMTQGTEYWLIMFFCKLYSIDPQEYWDLYGEIEKPHAYSHFED